MTEIGATEIGATGFPDLAMLGSWIYSWVQPDGAIHGFHNHSVWGGNPWRHGDMTAGHSTFSAVWLMGLALAVRQSPDARATQLLKVLVDYQIESLQADGQFAHIGFQVGELSKAGLIHNAVPCVALCGVVLALEDRLAAETRDRIDRVVRRVLEACRKLYPPRYPGACCNQEYARIWAQLLHSRAFGHGQWDQDILEGLDHLIVNYHVPGIPDHGSSGTLRGADNTEIMEPAEYYGLMIAPLVEAFQRFGRNAYWEEAQRLASHCVRSSWVDGHGQRRLHRLWRRVNGRWLLVHEPMLISGMGLTLAAIEQINRLAPDDMWESFLAQTDRTYRHYQHPAGFFLAASGWSTEADIVPCTAWQSHDFYHLVQRHGLSRDFWDRIFAARQGVAVVLGHNMIWLEDHAHWALCGYETCYVGCELIGRKDRAIIHLDMPSWLKKDNDKIFKMNDPPRFLRTDTHILQVAGRREVLIRSAQQLPWQSA